MPCTRVRRSSYTRVSPYSCTRVRLSSSTRCASVLVKAYTCVNLCVKISASLRVQAWIRLGVHTCVILRVHMRLRPRVHAAPTQRPNTGMTKHPHKNPFPRAKWSLSVRTAEASLPVTKAERNSAVTSATARDVIIAATTIPPQLDRRKRRKKREKEKKKTHTRHSSAYNERRWNSDISEGMIAVPLCEHWRRQKRHIIKEDKTGPATVAARDLFRYKRRISIFFFFIQYCRKIYAKYIEGIFKISWKYLWCEEQKLNHWLLFLLWLLIMLIITKTFRKVLQMQTNVLFSPFLAICAMYNRINA